MTPDQTLPDRPCRPGGILLVGINPAPTSVAAGHYYQGTLGQRLWGRLRRLGLLDDAGHAFEDDAFVDAGNGLTDLVKRPTRGAGELDQSELAAGRKALAEKVADWRPALLLFAFRAPAEALLGSGVRPGPCGPYEGVPAFLFSGPYASTVISGANDAEFQALRAGRGATTSSASSGKTSAKKGRIDMSTGNRPVKAPRTRLPGGGPTQTVTDADLAAGRIRLPAHSSGPAKSLFPDTKGKVQIVLRGEAMSVSYDPRLGSDQQRSGVLGIGKAALARLVSPGEVLWVSPAPDGVPTLD